MLSLALIAALTPTPSFDELRAGTLGSESTLLSRDGEPLQRLRVDMTRRQLEWTALDSMSPSLVRAVVAAEDHRFWWHFGFDPASGCLCLDGSVWQWTWARREHDHDAARRSDD